MKRLFLFLSLAALLAITTQAQYTIPDPAFAAKLQQIVPNAMTGNVLDEYHPDVTSLFNMNIAFSGIQDLSGISFFTSLVQLDCSGNPGISLLGIPFSLEELYCGACGLQNIPYLPNGLLVLDCSWNFLSTLPTLPSSLEDIACNNNALLSLPTLPSSLNTLSCEDNLLTSLPSQLPSSLTELNCSFNSLTSLPPIPPAIWRLNCDGNSISSLPVLPSSMSHLSCVDNQLSSLPALPNSLLTLLCFDNQIGSLPALPSFLRALSCQRNSLFNLPTLPSSLRELECHGNNISSLPSIPGSLEQLNCHSNSLTLIPTLPSGLLGLICNDNSLTCLPILPNALTGLVCYNNAINCLPNAPPNLLLDSAGLGFAPVLCTTTDPCFPSETITGSIFYDTNGNGVKDVGELPFVGGVAEAQPGNYLSGVDVNGSYGIPVQAGSYTVQGQPVLYHTITTVPHNVTINAGSSDTANHIGYQAIPGIYDLVAQVSAGVTRPGFNNNINLQVKNIGTEATTASISFDFDPVQNWMSANNTPDTQSGSNATWNQSMQPGDCWSANITLNTPPNVALLGTPVQHVLNATPGNADNTPADNTFTFNDAIVGSYDPNDKLSSVPSIVESEVQSGTTIDYTIRFQNTGTFLAENVLITDTLPQELQTATFSFLASSHAHLWYIENDILHIRYDGIQLPDSTSDEPGSHGFFKFRITPETNLVEGDSIVNIANIYFDFNEPVITEPNVIHIEGEVLLLNAQVFLGGPYDQVTGLMNDGLKTAGLIPLTEPYTSMGYVAAGTQPSSVIDANVLQTSGSDAIVDWIIVELRSSSINTQVVASRYGLIQRDGDVVDLDGVSPLAFQAPVDAYYIAIRHRNHLGVLSGLSYSLSTTLTSVGFSYPQTPTYGINAQQDLNGVTMLWSGNVNGDGVLKYTGTTNDRDLILQATGGNVPTATLTGYRAEDVNMDGVTKYTGPNNDRDPILVNIGGNVPTATRIEQLP